ncbi:MAG: hypothetical protein ACKOFN_11825 [Vulcanococcus sp.]
MAAPAADNHANGQPISAMVFNSKGKFFLNLDETGAATPVTVAPVAKPAPKAQAKPKASAPVSIQAPAASGAPASAPATTASSNSSTAPEPVAAPQGQGLTTAEAIAAELAAAQAARPAVVDATFAPDCLTPGGALPMRRRRGGANLAGFRSMAGGLFGKN